MKVQKVLEQLKKNQIQVGSDTTEKDGTRIIIVGCALPSFPFGPGRFVYYTLVLSPGQDEVAAEELDAMKRHLWHMTTDIFEDDLEAQAANRGDDDEDSN